MRWLIAILSLAGCVGAPAQTLVKIGDDSKPAVETLRRLAERIRSCPEMVTSETRWGTKSDEIKRTYEGPPHNVTWDVLPADTVRAPYLGYVEFSLPMRYWVPEAKQHKYNKTFGIGNTLDFENVLASASSAERYRYEFDLGPEGLQFARALRRMPNATEWLDNQDAGKSCWHQAVTDTYVASARVPAPDAPNARPQIESKQVSPGAIDARWGAYRKAAEQGNAEAQWRLGWIYEDGEGVPQDYAEAAVWYRKAAEQGNAEAQWRLGTVYDRGEGVPQDYSQAAVWYRKAAEKGNAGAQLSLGLLFEDGHGVPQDYAQAAIWLHKAAEQEYALAEWALGTLYCFGKGVPQDYAEAYFWLDVAAARMGEGVNQANIASERNDVASHLTPAALIDVQARARKWFEDHPIRAH